MNNNQSNIEWEKILHKIRGKYSYTFQSCDKAMELWIELLNTSINGWHESVTEDGKAYWWRKGMDAKIDIQWENPTKYQSSATTATEQEDPEEEISSETSDYATQFHAKFSEMQRKMQRNKPLEAALSRSNHHKPTEKKVSKIKSGISFIEAILANSVPISELSNNFLGKLSKPIPMQFGFFTSKKEFLDSV